jgi:hypothetical protein
MQILALRDFLDLCRKQKPQHFRTDSSQVINQKFEGGFQNIGRFSRVYKLHRKALYLDAKLG